MRFSKEQLDSLQEKYGISAEAVETLSEMVADKIKEVEDEAEEKVKKIEEEAEERVPEITEKAEAYAEYVKEELTEIAEAYAEYVKEEITSKVTEYTDYAMNEYVNSNKEKFEKLELFERMEMAFQNIKGAFESNGFKLDENGPISEVRKELIQAEAAFENVFEELQDTKAKLEEANLALLFERNTRDLTDTQKERIKVLSEKVKFDGVKEFETALDMLIEQVKKPEPPKPKAKQEEYINESTSLVDAVVKTLQRK